MCCFSKLPCKMMPLASYCAIAAWLTTHHLALPPAKMTMHPIFGYFYVTGVRRDPMDYSPRLPYDNHHKCASCFSLFQGGFCYCIHSSYASPLRTAIRIRSMISFWDLKVSQLRWEAEAWPSLSPHQSWPYCILALAQWIFREDSDRFRQPLQTDTDKYFSSL